MARWGKRVWMKRGALGYYECLGDDLKGMPGCGTFTKLAQTSAASGRATVTIVSESDSTKRATVITTVRR